MKKILIAFIALFTSVVTAQSEQQSIELPDFVITGRQSVNVPAAKKRKPDFISTLSRDFFTPSFSPEELPLFFSTDPSADTPQLKIAGNQSGSRINIQLGKYSFPAGEFSFSRSYENYLAAAHIWGCNIKEYIPNAGYNNSGIALTNDLFISTKSDVLPGAAIKIAADYKRDSYRFYASAVPAQLRETNSGSALISISDSYNRWINFGAGIAGRILSLNDSGLKETGYNLNGMFEFKLDYFTAGFKADYTGQSLSKNPSGIGAHNYLDLDGYVKLLSSGTLSIKAGVNYSSGSSNTFFAPFGMIEYKLTDGLTLSAEFNPHTEYYTVSDFIRRNIYYNPGLTDNTMIEFKTDINGLVRYEYQKLFSVSVNAGFARMNNNFYLQDLLNPGKFDITLLAESERLSGGLKFAFFPAQFGYFFGEVQFQNVKDIFGNAVPYEPDMKTSLTYGYNFDFGLGIEFNYKAARGIFTDIFNTVKLKDYSDLSIAAGYEIYGGLKLTADFQNIFNGTNFVWKQYQEKPFDLLLGIEYHW